MPHVVVTDPRLPDMEAPELAAKLRELYAVVLAGRRDLAAVGGG